jgi:cytoskeletal protein RodZ
LGHVPDIGSTLREARMREHIDIAEVEAQTKIRAKYLRAIENEEWDLLPGPVYAKSFLRSYGDYLGLDSRMLVDEFRRRYERPSEQEIRPVSARRRRDRDHRPPGPRVPSWVSILLVVVVILVILGVVGSLGTGSKSNNTTGQQATAGSHKPHHNLPTTAARTTPNPAPPTKVTLHMVPTGPVYVCLVRGDGARLIFEQTYNPGQTIPAETASKLLLTLGNNNVQIKVNGRTVPVAASPTAIRLLITPTAIQHIPPTQQPTCP